MNDGWKGTKPMSKHTLQAKLDQINLKIQQAQEEREAFLKEYYGAITEKLKMIEAHVLPTEVLVGAILDAIQRYNANESVIKKWEGMAHPFFRTKRPSRAKSVASKHRQKYNPDSATAINTAQAEKELLHE